MMILLRKIPVRFVMLYLGLSVFFVFFNTNGLLSQESENFSLNDELIQRWFSPVSIQIEGGKLSSLLEHWGEKYGFTVFIDRRVDPDQLVSGSVSNVPVIKAIQMLLEPCHLSFWGYDTILYVGPPDGGGKISLYTRQIKEKLNRQSSSKADDFLMPISFTCEKFASPESSLMRLASKLDFRWEKLEHIPFDCWRERKFYQVTPVDLIQLLLIGFDVRVDIDLEKRVLKPSRVPDDEPTVQVYDKVLIMALNQEEYPNCRFESGEGVENSEIRVSGPMKEMVQIEFAVAIERMEQILKFLEEHENSILNGNNVTDRNVAGKSEKNQRRRKTTQKTKVLTGTVQNKPLGQVLQSLEASFDREFVLDSSLEQKKISEESLVSCEFKQADEETVYQTIADNLRISWRKDKGKIVFFAR